MGSETTRAREHAHLVALPSPAFELEHVVGTVTTSGELLPGETNYTVRVRFPGITQLAAKIGADGVLLLQFLSAHSSQFPDGRIGLTATNEQIANAIGCMGKNRVGAILRDLIPDLLDVHDARDSRGYKKARTLYLKAALYAPAELSLVPAAPESPASDSTLPLALAVGAPHLAESKVELAAPGMRAAQATVRMLTGSARVRDEPERLSVAPLAELDETSMTRDDARRQCKAWGMTNFDAATAGLDDATVIRETVASRKGKNPGAVAQSRFSRARRDPQSTPPPVVRLPKATLARSEEATPEDSARALALLDALEPSLAAEVRDAAEEAALSAGKDPRLGLGLGIYRNAVVRELRHRELLPTTATPETGD